MVNFSGGWGPMSSIFNPKQVWLKNDVIVKIRQFRITVIFVNSIRLKIKNWSNQQIQSWLPCGAKSEILLTAQFKLLVLIS